MTIIRMQLGLQATEYDTKVQTCAQHRNSESGYSSVKQSSRYITHGLYACAAHWQHIRCSARHMEYIVAYTKVAWTDEVLLPYSSTCTSALTEWLQHRNYESGNNTRNSAIEEVGCSRSMSLPLVNHFWINTWCTISSSNSTRWGSLRLAPTLFWSLLLE